MAHNPVGVVALIVGQSQGANQGGEDCGRGVVSAALLKAGEVVDRDAGERGALLAPRPGRPPSGASG